MRTIAAAEFKAKCLAVMDEVRTKRQPIIITKRGKPIAKLVPISEGKDDIFGFAEGQVKILGDLIEPAIPIEEWERLK